MKEVFIGSSSEGLKQAAHIAEILSRVPGLHVKLWDHVFLPGMLTFEVIEQVSKACAGAVILATPDDSCVINQAQTRSPRTNIMIEMGYLCALIGRKRVALCKYDETSLATDLAGFTHIKMGLYPGDHSSQSINQDAELELLQWGELLPNIVEDVPRVEVVHGYSGRWEVTGVFRTWFGICLNESDYAESKGHIDLYIPRDGNDGRGTAHLEFTVQVTNCYAEYRATHLIRDVNCHPDGSISFTSDVFSRKCYKMLGTPPQSIGFEDDIPGDKTFEWIFKPIPGHPRQMRGKYINRIGKQIRAHALVTTLKVS